MKTLFINASSNSNGAVSKLASQVISGKYQTINLIEQNLHQLGQPGADDFNYICEQINKSDVIVIGTPVYFKSMSGSLKLFIDRLSELSFDNSPLNHKDLYLLINYVSTPTAVNHIQSVVKLVAKAFHMKFKGTTTNFDLLKKVSNWKIN